MSTSTPTSLQVIAVAVYASEAARVATLLDHVSVRDVGSRFVVGGGDPTKAAAAAAGAIWVKNVAGVVSALTSDISHVWLLHDDVVPRPDALSALVNAAEQIDASLVGSKVLVLDQPDVLESVGGATDVFLVADTDLTSGELDQEQYDVVRDVAFVPGESLLIRRDLLKGLGGPDALLPPVTQAIDFAARARLTGGRVAVVPSSEVLHAGTCRTDVAPWRETAATWRSATKLYSGLTTAWVLPIAVLISFVDAIGRLFLLELQPLLNLFRSVVWNAKHAVSTLKARRQARRIAVVDDGELFRYQHSGSHALQLLATDVTEKVRERSTHLGVASMINEERMFWQRPDFPVLLGALALIAMGFRSILVSGLPVSGFVLPMAAEPLGVLAGFAGGWNPAGFGTTAPVHSAAAVNSLFQFIFGESTMIVVLAASVFVGFLSIRRLLLRFGAARVPAVLGALVGIGGLAAQAAGEAGYWPVLPAIGAAAWATAGVLTPWPQSFRGRLAWLGSAVLSLLLATAYVPYSLAVPILVTIFWALFGVNASWAATIRSAGVTVASAVVLGPWLWWYRLDDLWAFGDPLRFVPELWLVASVGFGLLLVLLVGSEPHANVAGVGAVVAIAGSILARLAPGLEPSAGAMVLMAIGLAAVAAGVSGSLVGRQGLSRVAILVAQVATVATLIALGVAVGTGRWHLPADQYEEVAAVIAARAEPHGADRILFVGSDLPGQVRTLDGVPYRVMAGSLSLSEAWLAPSGVADLTLENTLRQATDPANLRPGLALAELGVRWIVVTAPSTLDPAFVGKLDLKELPVDDPRMRIFENVQSAPIARSDGGAAWSATEGGFAGSPAATVTLSVNPSVFDQTNFPVIADGSAGEVAVPVTGAMRSLAWLAVAVLLAAVGGVIAGIGSRS